MGGRGNSLKQTYIDKGVHVKRTGTNKGERGSKIGSFEQTYFLNDPEMGVANFFSFSGNLNFLDVCQI